jgi:hypothetical protein
MTTVTRWRKDATAYTTELDAHVAIMEMRGEPGGRDDYYQLNRYGDGWYVQVIREQDEGWLKA